MAGERDAPRPYRPNDGVTLVGPFWTRRQVARYLGVTRGRAREHRHLLRIEGALSVEEVYPVFQFSHGTVRREVVFLAQLLKRRVTDVEACDWLLRQVRSLDNRNPIDWLVADGDVDRVVRCLPAPSRPIPGGAGLDGEIGSNEVPVWPPTPVPIRRSASGR